MSPRLQHKICLLGADLSFQRAARHLQELLGVRPATETIRSCCQRQARRIARWQATGPASAKRFQAAPGNWEFAVDAGKVNTREHGWRDLKIAVVQKRPSAEPAGADQWQSRRLPEPTARRMWAEITTSKRFRRWWPSRLRRLGLRASGLLHVLGDGAPWIWKSAQRAFRGCRQTLDIYHACEHIGTAAKTLYGEGTAEMTAMYESGRKRLLEEGWTGVCRLVGEELEREDTASRRAALDRLLKYFLPHLKRLDYAGRLAGGEAIGSGAVEGAAKTLGLRLKARGARWRHKNAQAMAALVCCRQTEQWEQFWNRAA